MGIPGSKNVGLALLLGVCGIARGQVPDPPVPPAPPQGDPDSFTRLPGLLLKDTEFVLQRPRTWDATDWSRLGLGAAGLLGAALALDRPLDKAFSRNARPSWDHLARNVGFLGGSGSILIAGGAYLGGSLLGNPGMKSTGIDAGISMAIAQLILATPLEFAAGRSRPFDGKGSGHFKPFHGGSSFPSGHAIQAFVLASVISAHADSAWVTGFSYGTAALVGLARMEQRQHFLSDVLGGAVIGTLVGKTVVGANQALRNRAGSPVQVSFQPLVGAGYQGAMIRVGF